MSRVPSRGAKGIEALFFSLSNLSARAASRNGERERERTLVRLFTRGPRDRVCKPSRERTRAIRAYIEYVSSYCSGDYRRFDKQIRGAAQSSVRAIPVARARARGAWISFVARRPADESQIAKYIRRPEPGLVCNLAKFTHTAHGITHLQTSHVLYVCIL